MQANPPWFAKLYARREHRVYGLKILDRVPDVELPLEPRKAVVVLEPVRVPRKPLTVNRIERSIDIIEVVDRGKTPVVLEPPLPRRKPAPPSLEILRVVDDIVPEPERGKAVFFLAPPFRRRRPAPRNVVAERVPDVALPLEYRRPIMVLGHSKRKPNYFGVRQ